MERKQKQCAYEGCTTRPYFGPLGGAKKDATHCSMHRPVNYVDVVNKQCAYEGCKTQPTFGSPGGARKDAKPVIASVIVK